MLIVQKYGGTSVGSIDRIRNVAARALRAQQQGNQVVVIVSAMAGETNRLVELANAIDPEQKHRREHDVLISTGEQVSVALVAMAINEAGGSAVSFLGHQIQILTDSAFSCARIRKIEAPRLYSALDRGAIPVVAGFQGIDDQGNITTLGRGGSDTSAVAVAAAIDADVCEIYTDVDGVCTTDPNICPDARKLSRVTFQEMMELASLGAKVLQMRSVEVAGKYGVPIHVRSSFNEGDGTMVVSDDTSMEDQAVTGVTADRDQARVTIYGLPYQSGMQAKIFRPLADAGIVVDIILQNPPFEDKTNLSFTVAGSDLRRTLSLVQPVIESAGADGVRSDDGLAKVSIVGAGMRSRPGVAQEMFEILAGEQINILMISTSEIKVSCVIDRPYAETAVRVLHKKFGLANGACSDAAA